MGKDLSYVADVVVRKPHMIFQRDDTYSWSNLFPLGVLNDANSRTAWAASARRSTKSRILLAAFD